MASRTPALRLALTGALLLATGACHSAADKVPGDMDDHRPWNGITAAETIHLAGTEPFWGGQVANGSLRYTTPEQPDGTTIAVSRFAGRGGVSFSGELAGAPLTLAVTPAQCSDGMSDRVYPFVATLQIGADVRRGCAWTDRQRFTGQG